MYSNFGQSQTISKSRLGFFKKVKMYKRNFHAIGQLTVKSIGPKFPHISVYHYFFIYCQNITGFKTQLVDSTQPDN